VATLGCVGPQSTLDPAGREAEVIARLFWWMAGVGCLIWLGVVALTVQTIRRREPHTRRGAGLLIIGGGAVVPTVVLAVLLVHGLSLMPGLLALPPEGSLKIAVSGEQWWWRIRYHRPGMEPVELANEIRLPVGERVAFELSSTDVIHSFWIPALGGKMDMIPGRTTRLALQPTRTGVFRGACAEYCGTSHALMAFPVVVVEQAEFAAWLAHQAEPAPAPAADLQRGQELFVRDGCGACHAVRGTAHAAGVIGPDLTHVGSRLSLAAGLLPNEPGAFARWLSATGALKPDVHMPAFGMLPEEDRRALAAYLDGLE
jgi:cytochrome c oxidase subunit II